MSTSDVELKRWEKIVLEWLGDKMFDATFKTKWVIEPLTHRLFKRGVIPELVSHNATLYEILVLQMEKQLLLSLQVPQAIQVQDECTGNEAMKFKRRKKHLRVRWVLIWITIIK
jgi:hypothetical protein